MPELAPYPGSPSLSSEAREKVLQTFRHTLDLARRGRNEEALLGCDFILKMDARFQPARKLLETLRGVAAGTVVDLSGFGDLGGAPAPAPVTAPAPSPAPTPFLMDEGATVALPVPDPFATPAPARPVAPPPPSLTPQAPKLEPPPPPSFAPSAPAAATGGGLDDLAFDDFAASDPFASAALAATAPAPPPPAFRGPEPTFAESPVSSPGAALDSSGSLDNPFASPSAGGGLEDLGFHQPPSFSPPATPAYTPGGPGAFGEPASPAPSFGEQAAAPSLPPQGASSADPRIVQFLKQGDEAMARGQSQEAIDLWSRVFLIDLANEDASRRIDAARESQADSARKVDMLLSEGIGLYDAGDLNGARSRFLDVLALSEHDSTARSYLNQIDTALAPKEPTPDSFGASPDFMKDELEAPVAPSFAADRQEFGGAGAMEAAGSGAGAEDLDFGAAAEERRGAEARTTAAPQKGGRLDARILIVAGVLLLGGIGFFAYRMMQKPAAPPPVPQAQAPSKKGAAGEDLIAKAQGLFDQGSVDEALEVLRAMPESDPRHGDAIALIDKIKSTAPPPPPAAAPSAAQLDEMRIAGLAAIKSSRYIDAVKALDPVVKARPEDAEASQALTRARDQVGAMGNAVRAYNEQDYTNAIKLLWDLRKQDSKNQDVEEFLFKAYYNDGVQQLQAGNIAKGAQAMQESAQLRPSNTEAQRHLKFARKYSKGQMDLLARIYTKHLTLKP